MRKLLALFIAIVAVFSVSVDAKEQKDFEVLFKHKVYHVILVNRKSPSENHLSQIGSSKCSGNRFCVIWFFNDKRKAMVGVKRAEAGNTWDPIPGLIGIYSKNKVTNQLICHDLKGGC